MPSEEETLIYYRVWTLMFYNKNEGKTLHDNKGFYKYWGSAEVEVKHPEKAACLMLIQHRLSIM